MFFSLSPTSPRSSPPPNSFNFMFILSVCLSVYLQKHTRNKKKVKQTSKRLIRKKYCPQEQNETKSLQNYHWIYCMLAWAWGLPWSVVNIPCEASLEKTDFFSFVRGYNLHTVSWWRMGCHVYLLCSVLGHHLAWACASLVCNATISVSSYVCEFLCILKIRLLWSHPSLLQAYSLPTSSSA